MHVFFKKPTLENAIFLISLPIKKNLETKGNSGKSDEMPLNSVGPNYY